MFCPRSYAQWMADRVSRRRVWYSQKPPSAVVSCYLAPALIQIHVSEKIDPANRAAGCKLLTTAPPNGATAEDREGSGWSGRIGSRGWTFPRSNDGDLGQIAPQSPTNKAVKIGLIAKVSNFRIR